MACAVSEAGKGVIKRRKKIKGLRRFSGSFELPEGRGCSVTEPLFLLSIKPLNDRQNLGNYFWAGNGGQLSAPSSGLPGIDGLLVSYCAHLVGDYRQTT